MKRKTWNKLASVAAATVLIIAAIGGTVLAAPPEGAKGSVTVHKFSRTTDPALDNHTGELLGDTSGLGNPLGGAGFTLYKLELPNDLIQEEYFTGGYVVDSEAGTVSFDTTEGDPPKVVSFGAAVDNPDDPGNPERFTDENGIAEFKELELGYYALVETSTPEHFTAAPGSVISIPLTKKDGTGYNYDIHVYPKNISEYPITKIVDDVTNTYKVGDTVDFTINAGFSNTEEAPDTVTSAADLKNGSNYGVMRIMDTLVGGLEYVSSSVNFITADGNRIPLSDGIGGEYEFTQNDKELTWELTNSGIDKAIDDDAIEVEVKLKAKILFSAGALTNSASSFVKKAGATTDPEIPITPPVQVPTGSIIINKRKAIPGDPQDKEPLAGAVFALAKGNKATEFLKQDGSTKTITDHSTIFGDPEIIKGTTGTDGIVIFSGLEYDWDNGSEYRLVELRAPSGYQLKESAIKADLPKESADKNVVIRVPVDNYPIGAVDPDNPKFTLPLTGGSGTLLFTLAGIAIMAVVVGIHVCSKRKQKV